LNDFIRRTDLRKVGKRALECLIKVGALDAFGTRPALLASLDRILALSASHFAAAEAGQMSLFGPQTGLVDRIELPFALGEVSRREQLEWERELIGLYVSDHPLSPVMDAIAQNITHYATELAEATDRQLVRVAGWVTRVRPHTTKSGKAMGFVTLEDVQGNIELVVFPRTWERYSDLLQPDTIVLVDGRVDARGAEPKVLVERVTTELKHVVPLGASGQQTPRKKTTPTKPVGMVADPPSPAVPPGVAEAPAVYDVDDGGARDVPPPPEPFPDAWEGSLAPGAVKTPSTPPQPEVEVEPPSEPAETPLKAELSAEPAAALALPSGEELAEMVARFMPSLPPKENNDIRMLTVTLRSGRDKVRDGLLLRRIFGMLISRPGSDRFTFHIFEGGRGYLLDFPNFTTRLEPELLNELHVLVGEENVRVEKIPFQ